MRPLLITLTAALLGSPLLGAIKTQEIDYKAGDTMLKGFLAYDDAKSEKLPGVIVAPEWWGLTDYPKKRASQLAELGYVALAIDMYGDGKSTNDPKEAGKWDGEVMEKSDLGEARLKAAIETLKTQPQVDPEKLAAIGYCFGGTCVLNMARMNLPLKGVVSFHGVLANPYKLEPGKIEPKVLVLHGADDGFEPEAQIKGFKDEMKKAKADMEFVSYSDTVHAFTNPESDQRGMPGVKYNAESDKRSWTAMKNFLEEIFGK